MPLSLALFQPDIPQNTGALLRLAACLDFAVHIIHPTGFPFSDTKLRRAGMDYIDNVELIEHITFAAFDAWRRSADKRLVLLTTKSSVSVYKATFESGDVIMVGRESAGVPDEVAALADLALRIPMAPERRSLNVALAASMVMGEALRQTGTLPKV